MIENEKESRKIFSSFLLTLTLIMAFTYGMSLIFPMAFPNDFLLIFSVVFSIPVLLNKYSNIKFRTLSNFSIAGLLLVFQIILIAHPKAYHLLVYWVGLSPILIVVFLQSNQARLWSIGALLIILINGALVLKNVGVYSIEVKPISFIIAGMLFWITTFALVYIFRGIRNAHRKELEIKNKVLAELKEEIESRNEELVAQNDEINRVNELLSSVNLDQKKIIRRRTDSLKKQSQQITEYSFINSHLLRAPVARIKGLVMLLTNPKRPEDIEDNAFILSQLKGAYEELDSVVEKINIALEQGEDISRDILEED